VVHDGKGADGIGGKREVVGILHRLDTSQLLMYIPLV
jgi:hypothetical protein